jgi:hypothetical protein
LSVFRNYTPSSDQVTGSPVIKVQVPTPVTPVKRGLTDPATPTNKFPLTPPPTVKSDDISIELKIENDEITGVRKHFVRWSKRRRIDFEEI